MTPMCNVCKSSCIKDKSLTPEVQEQRNRNVDSQGELLPRPRPTRESEIRERKTRRRGHEVTTLGN